MTGWKARDEPQRILFPNPNQLFKHRFSPFANARYAWLRALSWCRLPDPFVCRDSACPGRSPHLRLPSWSAQNVYQGKCKTSAAMVTMTTTAQQRQQLSYMTSLVNSMVVRLTACRDADQLDMTELLLHANKETIVSGKDLNFLAWLRTRQPPNSWNGRHPKKTPKPKPAHTNQPTKKNTKQNNL